MRGRVRTPYLTVLQVVSSIPPLPRDNDPSGAADGCLLPDDGVSAWYYIDPKVRTAPSQSTPDHTDTPDPITSPWHSAHGRLLAVIVGNLPAASISPFRLLTRPSLMLLLLHTGEAARPLPGLTAPQVAHQGLLPPGLPLPARCNTRLGASVAAGCSLPAAGRGRHCGGGNGDQVCVVFPFVYLSFMPFCAPCLPA